MCEPTFAEQGGLLWVDLGPGWPGFSEALNDGVSALSPSGEPPAASTYWIDHALDALDGATGQVIASGNASRIVHAAGGACAESDYELFERESMSLRTLREILLAWRKEVVAQLRSGDAARPSQGPYQRNPPS